jgi:hypothetical protein
LPQLPIVDAALATAAIFAAVSAIAAPTGIAAISVAADKLGRPIARATQLI